MTNKVNATLVITHPEARPFENQPIVWNFKTTLAKGEFTKIVEKTIVGLVEQYPARWNYKDLYEALIKRNDIAVEEGGYEVEVGL